MKRIWISLVAAGLLTIAAIAPVAGQNIFSVALDSVDDSGVNGGASVRGVDGGVEITVFISAGGEEGGVHPVHVHEGTCDDVGDVAYPLEDIEDGESVTTIDDIMLGDLMNGEYVINAHLSADEMDVYVMCGDIPAVEGLPTSGDDDATDDDDVAVDDDDDAAVDDEDDAVVDDEDDAVTDDQDDAVTDDADDAAADDEDEVAEEEDDAADDTEDLVPATGGAGMGAEGAVILMTVLSGAALGGGLLVRRRFAQA